LNAITTDVCVIGGGPAGTSAALRLAQLGHRVYLVERGDAARMGRDESVAPTIVPILDALGIRPLIQVGGLLRPARTCLLWSTSEEVARDGQALLVDRSFFDQRLRNAAAAAGVVILEPARARRPLAIRPGWAVPVDAKNGRLVIRARILVDARGRRAVGRWSGTPTIALCGRWNSEAGPDVPHMVVEVLRDGWIWVSTRPEGSILALAFVDMQRCTGLGRDARQRLYCSLLANSKLFMRYRPTVLSGEVEVRDATWRAGDQIVSTQSIDVGDRAFAMDPISSQGIQAALRSGMQAGAVIHTILSGGDVGAALRFYSESQRAAVTRHRRLTSAAYADQRLQSSFFWQQRASGAERQVPQTADVTLIHPETRVRLATDARVVDVPVIDGNLICHRAALMHPALERPVAWFNGTAVAAVLDEFKTDLTASALISLWSRQMTSTTARNLLLWLVERQIVVCCD
jgi:flavin-dependent dehydrogenase